MRVACDPASHHICVVDVDGTLIEVFGERGSLPGQFNAPSDVVVVSPHFDGEDAGVDHLDLVVVADRGNHRLQVFEPEGQLVAIIGEDDRESRAQSPTGAREGWPFFSLGPRVRVEDPAQLRWEDPWLVVINGRGDETRIDLAAALLPSFDEWLSAAPMPMLAAAHHHFRHKVRGHSLAEPLAAIETAFGCAGLDAGDVEATSRLWSLGWPLQLSMAVRDRHAAARDRAATRAAFRLGGAAAVSRVRAAIRLSLGAFATSSDLDREGGLTTREAS